MTEQEQKAIKWMKNVRDDAVVTLDHIAKEEPNVSPMLYAGRKEKAETIIKGFEELEQYRAIGTQEECRAAAEKKTTMDWDAKHDECICPRCATHNPTWKMRAKTVEHDKVYCWHCGQSVEF